MKRSIIRYRLILLTAIALLVTACSSGGQVMDGEDMVRSFTQISQEEARKMMEKDDGHIIIDVRRQDEFVTGHIPGAVCIPNESIGKEKPEELPDTDQIILVYCRSGNRSKQASQKLFDMGYTNVYEFGGIIDWTGETETGE
jgi:rhodanese-related sulfurtransferase